MNSEHIVVDAESTDGSLEWLSARKNQVVLSEKDEGMYDAINKGVQLSHGEIISYLNCDEQYLPGTLKKVDEFFYYNPKVDIMFGNTLIIQPDGRLLAYRKSFVPRWPYVWSSFLYVYTSSMFVRRRVFESGIMFDKNWKAAGDADFVVKVLRKGFHVSYLQDYLSAFMITGSNLSSSESADKELIVFRSNAPFWLRHLDFITHPLIIIEKFFHGAYQENFPLTYSVYTIHSPEKRREFIVHNASPLWKRWEVD